MYPFSIAQIFTNQNRAINETVIQLFQEPRRFTKIPLRNS